MSNVDIYLQIEEIKKGLSLVKGSDEVMQSTNSRNSKRS